MSTSARYRSGYVPEGVPVRRCSRHNRGAFAVRRVLHDQGIEDTMIKGLFALLVVFLLATFPATWLLMLFLGNLGLGLSYWGTLPLGILVSVLIGSTTGPAVVIRD